MDHAQQSTPSPSGSCCDSSATSADSHAAPWQEHEHLSAQLELDALRLLADAGTPELAKFAIDSVDEQQREQLRAEFAQALGFGSYADLLAASARVATPDDRLWFVTQIADGHWIGWNFIDVNATEKHATREAAIQFVEALAANERA